MPDREKVIKGLSCCAKWMEEDDIYACNSCPYHRIFDYGDHGCIEEVNNDAITLLKEQEAKTPVEYEHNGYWYYICPTCGNHDEELLRQWNYCPFCGQAVKWE